MTDKQTQRRGRFAQKRSEFEHKIEHIDKSSKTWKVLVDCKELFVIALFTAAYAIAVNRILVPHAIVGGGLTGICEVIYFASSMTIPIWLSTLALNTVLLAIAVFTVGWKFCIRTIYGVIVMTLWLRFIPVPAVPDLTDPFMAVVLGGLFCGTGLAVIYMNGGSTGGTDIVAMIVNKYKHVSMGRVLFMCDLVIIGCAYFLPEVRSLEKVLFGLTYTFMATSAVDGVMNRTRQSVQFFIFSQKYREIANAIMTDAHRGVTILDAEGGYSHSEIKVVTVLARKAESQKIFKIVKAIDPQAFVSQSQVTGVFGQGFESIKEKA